MDNIDEMLPSMDNTEAITPIDEAMVPSIVKEQMDLLYQYKKKINKAISKADQAQTSAQSAKEKAVGIFKHKEAIESLQSATVDLADAQVASNQAHKVSFQYQEKLGKTSKYLLALGLTNIALNRSVVRELEAKLKGASEEELDDLAKKELLVVVRQLKAQEDIMKTQTDLSLTVKEHDRLIAEGIRKDQEQDEELERQAGIDEKHDRMFREKEKRDQAQDKEILRQAKKDVEHDTKFAASDRRDIEQDEELARQAAKDAEHDALIALITKTNNEQDEELNRLAQLASEREAALLELKARGQEQDYQLSELQTVKTNQEQIIATILKTNENQESEIAALRALCDNLQQQINMGQERQTENTTELTSRIDSKSSNTVGIISLLIGAVALILVIIQFFFD